MRVCIMVLFAGFLLSGVVARAEEQAKISKPNVDAYTEKKLTDTINGLAELERKWKSGETEAGVTASTSEDGEKAEKAAEEARKKARKLAEKEEKERQKEQEKRGKEEAKRAKEADKAAK